MYGCTFFGGLMYFFGGFSLFTEATAAAVGSCFIINVTADFLSAALPNKFAIDDPPNAFTCFFSLLSRSAFNFLAASLSFFCCLASFSISFLLGFIADSVTGSDSSMPNPSNVKSSNEDADGC